MSSASANMLLSRGCGHVGALVGKRPQAVFGIGVLLFLSSLGLLLLFRPGVKLSFDEGYTTPDAPSIKELRAQVEFFGNRGEPWYMALFAQPRSENGSMIENSEFKEMKNFYRRIKQIAIKNKDGRDYTYMDYCEPMCDFNNVLFKTYDLAFFGLEWPTTSVFGYNANIGKHFFQRKMIGNDMVKANLSAVYFMVFINSTEMAHEMEEFERIVQREIKLHNANPSTQTILTQHSAHGMELEIRRGTRMIMPKVVVGLILTVVLLLASLVLLNRAHGRCTGLVLVQCVGACLVPCMALLSTLATFGIVGRHLNTLISVTPILIVAVAFDGILQLHNTWLRESNTRKDNVDEVLREVFAVALPQLSLSLGPAIGLLFGGLIPIEEFANISLFLGTALCFTYIYQITVFVPVMIWCSPVPRHIPLDQACDRKCGRSGWSDSLPASWASFLTRSTVGRLSCVALFLGLIIVPTAFGAPEIHGNLDYRQLLPPDSPNAKGVHFMSDVVWPEFLHILYIIEKPPNFENPDEFSRFEQFVAETEAVPMAMGRDANMIWLEHFKEHSKTSADAKALNMTYFKSFIEDPIYSAWRSGVQYELDDLSGAVNITRMVYMVAVNGTRTMADKAKVLQNFRAISARYPEFEAVPFDTETGMADVITQIPSVLFTIPALMYLFLFGCLLMFTSNVAVAVVSLLFTAVIYFSCVAITSLLGVELNPFSVAFLLMAAAMSPRFVVHVAYIYQQALRLIGKAEDERLVRLQETLRRSLLPTILSAVVGSAILLPMLFAPVIIFRQLAISNALLLTIGLLQTLYFVPAALSALPRQITGASCLLS